MATPIIKSSFAAGELSPSLWGRVDLAKFHIGASVMRNMFVNYRGGASSRAGLAFGGQCKQPGTSLPPRIIPFRFNIFQNYILEFGDQYMRVAANGAYVTESPLTITAITQANPGQLTIPGHNFVVGDWIYLANIGGMFQLNTRTVVVRTVAGSNITIQDTFGIPINTLGFNAFTVGGTAARIFTLTTPYAATDLNYLKYTQSADVMSLCLVNQQTGVEYQTRDLTRLAANNWTLAVPAITTSIVAPTLAAAGPSAAGAVAYGYVVTAIDSVTGQESVASNIAVATSAVNIAATFGTITVTWAAVTGASGYNIYKATPDFSNTGNFTNQLFGYAGSTVNQAGTTWRDNNIIPDFTTTPPLHQDPFAGVGNAPMEVAYFQQRRGYFGSLNQPDTYNLSQPGSYTNFDSSDPPIDSDAITGNPWAQQVNGIQFAIPMPGGLNIFNGLDAWQLSGTGGAGSPIAPSQQSATPQDSYGCSPTIQPLRLGNHILYVPQSGTSVQDMEYNYWNNMYAGTDISILSSHLLINYQIQSWGLARQPWKIIWIVRDDGKMVSLTYMKEQEVIGFARHDTNGLFQSVAVVTEPPVDAPYFVVKRYVPGVRQWAYYLERMDNRRWANVEECYCVDAGARLPQPAPNAILTATAAQATQGVIAGPVIVGGQNYSPAVQGFVKDPTGSGAVVNTVSVSGGVITGYTISPAGVGYTSPEIVFTDATGSGAQVQAFVDLQVGFEASAPAFDADSVGDVIRMGGGVATVTQYLSPTSVSGNLTTPITATIPNDPNRMPAPAMSGDWTVTTPVSTISGLDYLEGFFVTGLADGFVIPLTQVVGGQITLPRPASAVTIGLPYLVQLQSMHTDFNKGAATVQGDPVLVAGVTIRIEQSRDFSMGQDRPIASAQPNQAEYEWADMTDVGNRARAPNAQAAPPLYTGDRYAGIRGDWNQWGRTPNDSIPVPGEAPRAPGMVAVQQANPLPLNVLAMMPQIVTGDSDGQTDLM